MTLQKRLLAVIMLAFIAGLGQNASAQWRPKDIYERTQDFLDSRRNAVDAQDAIDEVERRFDVVAWGNTQSFTKNLKASISLNYEEYFRMYKDVSGHWKDSLNAAKASGIDVAHDDVYHGAVEWREGNDRKMKFYYAANYSSRNKFFYGKASSYLKAAARAANGERPKALSDPGALSYYISHKWSKKQMVASGDSHLKTVEKNLRNCPKARLIYVHAAVKNTLKFLEKDRSEVGPGMHIDWAKRQNADVLRREIKRNIAAIRTMGY